MLGPMLALQRQVLEGTAVCGARCVFGDEQVREWLFSQDYHAGFVSRHTHQLAAMASLEARRADR